jgi:hypothetical protein
MCPEELLLTTILEKIQYPPERVNTVNLKCQLPCREPLGVERKAEKLVNARAVPASPIIYRKVLRCLKSQ